MKRTICTALVALGVSTMTITAQAENRWQNEAKDAWIDGKAESVLLFNTNLNNFDINTDVRQGKVILTGKVESDTDKSLAEELVEGLEGVTSVDNKLTVVGNADRKSGQAGDDESSQKLTDAKVSTVVKTKLLFDSNVKGTAIDVSTKEGVVTLSGKVQSDAEKDLAVTITENTRDVRNVVDNLIVAK